MAGWLVLNTDASNPEGSDQAAIGAVLRQKLRQGDPMKVVAYISRLVGRMETQEAEYKALAEGLKLALRHEPDNLQVFTDSAGVADKINQETPRSVTPLHAEVSQLLAEFGERKVKVRISWLPRELNREADQRASDAFFTEDHNAWLSPDSGVRGRSVSSEGS